MRYFLSFLAGVLVASAMFVVPGLASQGRAGSNFIVRRGDTVTIPLVKWSCKLQTPPQYGGNAFACLPIGNAMVDPLVGMQLKKISVYSAWHTPQKPSDWVWVWPARH